MTGTRIAVTVLLAILIGGIPAAASAAPNDVPTTEAADADAADESVCSSVPGVAGGLCEGVTDVLGGGVGAIVGGGTDAVLDTMVAFVVDGAGWLLEQLAGFMDTSTRPDLQSEWFQAAYGDMAVIGMLGILPFLLLALIQALVRQDAALMVRATFGYVPLAAIGTAGAVVVVDLLVQLTDGLSGWVGRGLGADLSSFATGLGTALATMSVPTGGAVAGLAALIGAAVIAFASFVIWLELLLRQAAIYVSVLFFPLGFMAMVWPATAHWVRRLVQGLVAVILSKFVIVAVMALAASALDADVADEGFAVVISGGALLALAALSPYVLLRLIPVFDAGMNSQLEGTYRRPTAAVGTPGHSGQMSRMVRQRAGGSAPTSRGSGAASDGGSSGTAASGGASGAGAAGAGAAAGGLAVVAVGASVARSAGNHASRAANETATNARGGQHDQAGRSRSDANGSRTRSPMGASSSGGREDRP